MFVCWKKFCYAALTAKTFANFAPFLDPKIGVEKWIQKWCQNLTPKMGPKMAPKRGAQYYFGLKKIYKKSKLYLKYWVPLLGAIFWTPFWWSNSGTIFGTIFQPPFWGPKMVQNLQKFLLSKLHSKTFSSKQTCTSKCICSHFPANSIFEHNSILHLVKPSKITTSFDCHKCCT